MDRFDERLEAERAESAMASVAAAVVRDGAIAWTAASGTVDGRDGALATTDTQYRIGSISKTLTAVEVMRLRDEGRLDLADPIGTHLPDVPFGHVTIAQLLTHTSGLQAETNGPWWERAEGLTWDELMAGAPALVHAPGTRFHYSNVGFGVLGRLIAVTRGAPWFDVIREEILEPLGMGRTSFHPTGEHAVGLSRHPSEPLQTVEPEHDARSMAPAGQLWSTVVDLARWARFAGGDTADVLARSTWSEMTVPLAVDDRPGQAWATAQGLGWRVWMGDGSGRRIGHGGSMPGFLATLFAEPRTGLGVVVLANDTTRLGGLADDLLSIAHETWPHLEQPPVVQASAEVTAIAGDWFWGPMPYRLEPDGDGFVLGDVHGHRRSRFVRDGDGWRGLDAYFAGERLAVRPDGALDLATFILSRTPYDPAVDHPGGPADWR